MYYPGEGLDSLADFLLKVEGIRKSIDSIKTNKKTGYLNIPAAFDIEVSSFYQGEKLPENKRAVMYIWQFGIGNIVTTGRTWEQFLWFLDILIKLLGLNSERRLCVYVHNLAYEFQFIRKWFEWDKLFFLEKRRPAYCLFHGIEFRCSLKLSGGKALSKVAKDLQKYPVSKLIGNLDYEIIRTPITPLDTKELKYCENDIRVLLHYIQEKIETDGDITKIPLTNTGYVRNYCRKQCFKKCDVYHNLMKELTIDEDEYNQLKRAYSGGFTHANARYVKKGTLYNIGSNDLSSSYPTIMVLEKLPMSKANLLDHKVTENEAMDYMLSYCCMFDVEIFDLVPRRFQEHPLSKSKCPVCENALIDNGRVVLASRLTTTITESDYFVISEFYDWTEIKFYNFRYYSKGYLPTPFVKSILKLYGDKTSLKGDPEKEINYMISKNMINAGYGMMVTDPVRGEIVYNQYDDKEPFKEGDKNVEKLLRKYNNSIKRFLFYPWGVWITAYARANLFSGIIALGDDYVYSDTDSLKVNNPEKHSDYFKRYNQEIARKIQQAAAYHNISPELFSPKTLKGKEKMIGVWDDEGIYEKFKTIGAKRYLTFRHEKQEFEDNGLLVQLTVPTLVSTIAGANKSKTSGYLRLQDDPFEAFKNELIIPEDRSGRLILTYIDRETEGDIIDVNGVPYHYHERSSIHMEKSEYNLQMDEFEKYLKGLRDFSE